MKYSLIIPIYNEARIINELINQLNTLHKTIEIILIDDGSSDASYSILKEHKKNFVLLKNEKNYGKGFCINKALDFATNENIILMDGDLEIEIDNIHKLLKKYSETKTIVIGTRWNEKKHHSINYYGNIIINKIFNIIYGTSFCDILCCLKIINKGTLKSLDLKSMRFGIETEIMAKLAMKESQITQISVSYSPRTRKEGKKIRFSDAWIILWIMIKTKMGF